jgi:hypothetical protein
LKRAAEIATRTDDALINANAATLRQRELDLVVDGTIRPHAAERSVR